MALHIAALLNDQAAKSFYDGIGDILEQADEFDNKYLQVKKLINNSV